MTKIKTLKMTQQEIDILDWFMHKRQLDSVSQALRLALFETVQREGLSCGELNRLVEDRSSHPPRRSAKLCKLIGPRRRGSERQDSVA